MKFWSIHDLRGRFQTFSIPLISLIIYRMYFIILEHDHPHSAKLTNIQINDKN